jgi:hypothetical protein
MKQDKPKRESQPTDNELRSMLAMPPWRRRNCAITFRIDGAI